MEKILSGMTKTMNDVQPPRMTALRELHAAETGPFSILIGTILSARAKDEATFVTCPSTEDDKTFHSAHNYKDEDHKSTVIDGFDVDWMHFARNCYYEGELAQDLCQALPGEIEVAAPVTEDYSVNAYTWLEDTGASVHLINSPEHLEWL